MEVSSETNFVCHFGPFFALYPQTPPPSLNQNFEKMKNTSGDAIILNCATENMIK